MDQHHADGVLLPHGRLRAPGPHDVDMGRFPHREGALHDRNGPERAPLRRQLAARSPPSTTA
eukprot:8926851-Heterocapsa_arctica.AAC.1